MILYQKLYYNELSYKEVQVCNTVRNTGTSL